MRNFFATAASAAALVSSAVAATVPSIVIKGNKFFYENNGTQFYMRGVAYQQEYTGTSSNLQTAYTDNLADSAGCMRDLPYLIQLRTNTIRVYAINPDQNHDACMNALANAGIYVVADLSAPVPGGSINRDSPSWNDATYERYTSVVDAMAKYPNTLGFFAGNEVSNQPNNTEASAFVKAAVRDTKAYIKAKGYRTIGVGYATNDDAAIREDMANYFNCGDQSSAIDFWGYNIYSWCGESSFEKSGYDVRTKEFSTYSVPVFFAEYGCNLVEPRQFTDVPVLYGPLMNDVWSGGIVYMYFQEANNYGLVSVSGNTVSTRDDFNNLASQIASINPTGVNSAQFSPTNSPVACPTQNSNWSPKASPLPPSPNEQLCQCMYNSLSCVPANSVTSDDYGALFGTVCGLGASKGVCNGIAANATTGTYGAYGMCNATEQLGFALNQYYVQNGKSAGACAFSGSATLKAASTATGSCASLMSQAGTAGTGKVTASPVSGGSGSGGSGGTTGNAAPGPMVQGVLSSFVPMAVMIAVGVLSGSGMILL